MARCKKKKILRIKYLLGVMSPLGCWILSTQFHFEAFSSCNYTVEDLKIYCYVTQGYNSTLKCDSDPLGHFLSMLNYYLRTKYNVELWPGFTNQRIIIIPGLDVLSWPGVTMQCCESIPWVTIHRWIISQVTSQDLILTRLVWISGALTSGYNFGHSLKQAFQSCQGLWFYWNKESAISENKIRKKGIDTLNLSNILNHKSVQSNIPPYFE